MVMILIALMVAHAVDAGALRYRSRWWPQPQTLPTAMVVDANTNLVRAGLAAAADSAAGKEAKNETVHEEIEHGGSPGEGGGHMVPRAHVDNHTDVSHPQHWTYSAPGEWGKIEEYPECKGDGQSPINIESADVLTEEGKQNKGYLAEHMKYIALKERSIGNNGHNLQVNGHFGNLTLPDGEYEVKQFSFHFPSEHKVNGKLAAGEIHIVHQKRGSNGTDDLAVIAILLEVNDLVTSAEGKRELAFLSNLGFGARLPKEQEDLPVPGEVDFGAFHRLFGAGFWHYKGSLTTPPCSETVHWYVLQHAAQVAPKMVESFKALFPSPQNNRPVQPLNQRRVVFSEVAVAGEFEGKADEAALGEKTQNDQIKKQKEADPWEPVLSKNGAPGAGALAALALAGLRALV